MGLGIYLGIGILLSGFFSKNLHKPSHRILMIAIWPIIMANVIGMTLRKKTDKAIGTRAKTKNMLQASPDLRPYENNSPYNPRGDWPNGD